MRSPPGNYTISAGGRGKRSRAAATASTARGTAAATAGVHDSPKFSTSSASTPTRRMLASSGRRSPAWRPKASAVGRLTSWAEALRCVGRASGAEEVDRPRRRPGADGVDDHRPLVADQPLHQPQPAPIVLLDVDFRAVGESGLQFRGHAEADAVVADQGIAESEDEGFHIAWFFISRGSSYRVVLHIAWFFISRGSSYRVVLHIAWFFISRGSAMRFAGGRSRPCVSVSAVGGIVHVKPNLPSWISPAAAASTAGWRRRRSSRFWASYFASRRSSLRARCRHGRPTSAATERTPAVISDVHGDCPRAPQDAGEHGDALLGKGIGSGSAGAAPATST